MKVYKYVASATEVLKSAKKICKEGNAEFAGWGSHLIKHTRKKLKPPLTMYKG
jgi:hypothetical protein